MVLNTLHFFLLLNNRRGVKQEAYDKLARSLDIKGAKKKVYEVLSRELNIRGQWRTYDYFKAKKSAVFLEPITVRYKDY